MVMISCLWRLYSCFYVLYFLSYCLYNYTAGNSPRPTLPSWVGRIGGWQEGDKERFHAQSRYTRHIGIVLFGILQIYDWQHRLDYSARVCTLSTKGKRKKIWGWGWECLPPTGYYASITTYDGSPHDHTSISIRLYRTLWRGLTTLYNRALNYFELCDKKSGIL